MLVFHPLCSVALRAEGAAAILYAGKSRRSRLGSMGISLVLPVKCYMLVMRDLKVWLGLSPSRALLLVS